MSLIRSGSELACGNENVRPIYALGLGDLYRRDVSDPPMNHIGGSLSGRPAALVSPPKVSPAPWPEGPLLTETSREIAEGRDRSAVCRPDATVALL